MSVVGYYNGAYVSPSEAVVPLDERGHQFGDGVYEVIRVYGSAPFLLEWHLDRLMSSLEAIRIESPLSRSAYADLVQDLVARSGETEALIYLQVTRGSAVRNHFFPSPSVPSNISATVRPAPATSPLKSGKLLMLLDERWANAYIKTINLLPNILAKQAARDVGADEALLVRDGKMIESASSNLFFARDGHVLTAPADRYILPGITRRFVLDLALQQGIPVEEVKVPTSELSSMDSIFITGTGSEIFAIDTVLTHPAVGVDGELPFVAPHPLTLTADSCIVAWNAKSHDVVDSLRAAFDAKVAEHRAAVQVL